jgi:hypothetical protein
MDRVDFLVSLLAPLEGAERAAQDATLLMRFMERPSYLTEFRARGRLLSIEGEQGLGSDALQAVWSEIGLVRGAPQPFPSSHE